MRSKSAYFFILCILPLAFGCGYTTKSTLPSNLRTIHVKPFKNSINYAAEGQRNIYFPLLEVDVRNEVIERFLFDGNLRVTELEDADLILSGELKTYQRGVLRRTESDDVEEYRVQIFVDIELLNTNSEEVMWNEFNFAGDADYFLSGANATSEESAVDEAVVDLARRIVERTIEDW